MNCIFVVPYFSQEDLEKVRELLGDNVYLSRRQHIFFYSKCVAGKISQNLPHLTIVQCDISGEIGDIEQFIYDYFNGGNTIYSAYQHDAQYMYVLPLTDQYFSGNIIAIIFSNKIYILREGYLFFFQGEKLLETFLNTQMTVIKVLLEELPDSVIDQEKKLQDMVNEFCDNKIVNSHRDHAIPDKRIEPGRRMNENVLEMA